MPYTADQIANLDAELDALSTPTTAEVLERSQDYDDAVVAASAAQRAINGGGGGGSTPGVVRRLTFEVQADDLGEGPVTIYTPAADEVIGPAYLYDVVLTGDAAGNYSVVISRDEQIDLDPNFPPLAAWDSDLSRDGAGFAALADDFALAPLTVGPVRAGFGNQADVRGWPIPAWAAGTPKAQFDSVVAAGHIWEADPGGTTGGVRPDFEGNIGGSVVDNDITWTDIVDATNGGSATVSFDVCVPDTP